MTTAPCGCICSQTYSVVSLDLTDISGEAQRDMSHNVLKVRIDQSGREIPNTHNGELRNQLDIVNDQKKKTNYCGSCYGGLEPESGCCNTCEEVRMAYVNRGWSFSNPDAIDQCVAEGWLEKLKEQSNEGCNVSGRIRVNKVIGNLQLSPGRSFQTNFMDIHELVPYLRDEGNKHDFGHVIYELAFEGDDEYDFSKAEKSKAMKRRLGIEKGPLDNSIHMVCLISAQRRRGSGLIFLFRPGHHSTCSSTSSRLYRHGLN